MRSLSPIYSCAESRNLLRREGNSMTKRKRGIALLFLLLFVIRGNAKAAELKNLPDTPATPASQWKPEKPEDQKKLNLESVAVPAEVRNRQNWTLTDLIDLALQVSPTTRTTWYAAQAAAAGLRSK